MIRRPPRSTLPYTTLFRSLAMLRQIEFAVFDMRLHSDFDPASGQTDRKSTRLNSSHGYISYAVFCLKKKKKNRDQDNQCNTVVAISLRKIAMIASGCLVLS